MFMCKDLGKLFGARNDVQGCEGLVKKGVLWPLLEAAAQQDAPACMQDTQAPARPTHALPASGCTLCVSVQDTQC